MISGTEYLSAVKLFFSFLENEFEMKISEEKTRGNSFYDIQYADDEKIISISYENIESYLQVIILKLENGKLPDYDNKDSTLHLNNLNREIFSLIHKRQIKENSNLFNKFHPKNELERKLLKSAKELRIVLKKGINNINPPDF